MLLYLKTWFVMPYSASCSRSSPSVCFCLLRVTVTPDGILWIHNISRADEGKYTCFAENYLGKANSTGHLSVRGTHTHTHYIHWSKTTKASSLVIWNLQQSNKLKLEMSFNYGCSTQAFLTLNKVGLSGLKMESDGQPKSRLVYLQNKGWHYRCRVIFACLFVCLFAMYSLKFEPKLKS